MLVRQKRLEIVSVGNISWYKAVLLSIRSRLLASEERSLH
jgi:hypothetical protein